MQVDPTILWALGGILVLAAVAAAIALRRVWTRRRTRRQELYRRIIRSELMQAVARGDRNFLIEHWRPSDRRAAFEVAGQILTFLSGPDRGRLEQIIEDNAVLRRPLQRINRLNRPRRIAMVRQLAPFANPSVQATLHHLMREDRSPLVRLEAALAITVSGELPPPFTVWQCISTSSRAITPKHLSLFRVMVRDKADALIALALYREDKPAQLLAIDALAHAEQIDRPRARDALTQLRTHADRDIRLAAEQTLMKLAQDRRSAARTSATVLDFVPRNRRLNRAS